MSPLRTPQSCTSLYTPFGVYAGSSSDAELLSKRERAIHCRAYGFSRSCTSLYTPFGVCAGSSSDAELLSKRGRTRNPLSGLRFFSVMYVFVHSRRKIRALRALRAASAQTADNSRMILCRLCARLSRVRLCTLLSAFAQAPRLTRNCFPNGANAQSIVGFARGCGANGRQFPHDTLSPFGVTMSATGAAGAPCPPRAWSARSILQSKRRVVRYENRRRH